MHTCTVPVDGLTESGSAARDPTYSFKSFSCKVELDFVDFESLLADGPAEATFILSNKEVRHI